MLKRGAYNPLNHSSELFEYLTSVQYARGHSITVSASSRGPGRNPLRPLDHRLGGPHHHAVSQWFFGCMQESVALDTKIQPLREITVCMLN